MKIAICYSGQERDFSNTYLNHKSIFEKIGEAYYFFHFWEPSIENGKESLVEFIESNFERFEIEIEVPKEFTEYSGIQPDSQYRHPIYPNTISQLYSLQQVNNMKKKYEHENGFKFDCVIRLRTDILFINDFEISQIDLSKINLYGQGRQSRPCFTKNSINDHFAISDSEKMDMYSSIFENLPRILEDSEKGMVRIIAEDLFGYNLTYYGIYPPFGLIPQIPFPASDPNSDCVYNDSICAELYRNMPKKMPAFFRLNIFRRKPWIWGNSFLK